MLLLYYVLLFWNLHSRVKMSANCSLSAYLSVWRSFNAHHVHFNSLSLSPICCKWLTNTICKPAGFFLPHLAAVSASSTALQERFHLLEQTVKRIRLFMNRIEVVETVTFFDRYSCIKVDWWTSDCYSVIANFQIPKDESFVNP
jgi:hypothetical protein